MKRNWMIMGAALTAILLILVLGRHSLNRGGVIGKPTPDFHLTSLDHQQLSPEIYRGKVLALNFWATWCGPCKREMPALSDLQKRYADKGVQIIGVAMDSDNDQELAGFMAARPVSYPIASGDDALGDRMGGVNVVPTTVIIGRDGVVRERIEGADVAAIEEAIQKLL